MTTQKTAARPPTVTEAQKRSIACPQCGARKGKPCRGSRIPGANTFGGGWGGPPDLDRAHGERRTAYLQNFGTATARRRAALALITATRELDSFRGDALMRIRLTDTLSAYEATGDHNHSGKPLAVGAACDGGDCIVAKARALLSSELSTQPPTTPEPRKVPTEYEEEAAQAAERGDWARAAELYDDAAGASIGARRSEWYTQAAERCRANAAEAERIAACPCAQTMKCLCAGHARGNAPSMPCDTSEGVRS